VYTLYIKLVVFPRNIDFANENDFWAALYPFLFQFAFREFFFAFDVRFLGTAICIIIIFDKYLFLDNTLYYLKSQIVDYRARSVHFRGSEIHN
jgi:hypothetical protein